MASNHLLKAVVGKLEIFIKEVAQLKNKASLGEITRDDEVTLGILIKTIAAFDRLKKNPAFTVYDLLNNPYNTMDSVLKTTGTGVKIQDAKSTNMTPAPGVSIPIGIPIGHVQRDHDMKTPEAKLPSLPTGTFQEMSLSTGKMTEAFGIKLPTIQPSPPYGFGEGYIENVSQGDASDEEDDILDAPYVPEVHSDDEEVDTLLLATKYKLQRELNSRCVVAIDVDSDDENIDDNNSNNNNNDRKEGETSTEKKSTCKSEQQDELKFSEPKKSVQTVIKRSEPPITVLPTLPVLALPPPAVKNNDSTTEDPPVQTGNDHSFLKESKTTDDETSTMQTTHTTSSSTITPMDSTYDIQRTVDLFSQGFNTDHIPEGTVLGGNKDSMLPYIVEEPEEKKNLNFPEHKEYREVITPYVNTGEDVPSVDLILDYMNGTTHNVQESSRSMPKYVDTTREEKKTTSMNTSHVDQYSPTPSIPQSSLDFFGIGAQPYNNLTNNEFFNQF